MKFKENDLYKFLKDKLQKYLDIISEKNNRKILLISIIFVFLILTFELINIFAYQPHWIINQDGKKVGVERPEGNKNKSLSMMVEVKNKNGVKTYPVDIRISGSKKAQNNRNNTSKAVSNKRNEKNFEKEESLRIDLGIQRELKNEDKKNKKIYMFPKQLQDGDRLIWTVDKKGMIPKALFLFPIIPVGIVVYSESEKRKKGITRINSIRWSIPSFTHQVVLYMNSGLIIPDIMTKLFMRYSESNNKNALEDMVINAYKNSEIMHMESIAVLQKYADESSVSEFIRIVAIISDGQIKGVDIRGKLENESKILWHDRKKTAEERGHIAESKLAVPLSILLLVLMLITAAPAMMEL
ncbi:hypothetical protein [Gemella morbillorum]